MVITKAFSLSYAAALMLALCMPAFSAVGAIPSAPPSLTAVAVGSNVSLAWTAPKTNTNGTTPAKVAGYNLYRSTSPTIKSQTGNSGAPAPYLGYSSTLKAGVLTYSDVGVAANGYYYAVSAWYCDTGGCGESAVSPVAQSTPSTTAGTVVSGTATFGWTAPVKNSDGSALTDLAGYRIYRGTACDSQSVVATIPNPGTTSYKDSGLPLGTYCYSMTSFNVGNAESLHSPNLTVTFNTPPVIPSAPGVPTVSCVIVAPSGMTASCTVSP